MVRFAVAPELVERLGGICLVLPEVVEEDAWAGTRWRVRGKTFAQILAVTDGRPPSYARAVGAEGPVVILTCQITAVERDLFTRLGPPYWAVREGRNVGGVVLGEHPDWEKIAELVIDSYRLLAPRRLAEQVSISAPG